MKIKLLNEKATIPTRGTDGSAGLDLYSCKDVTIAPHTTKMIPTGIAVKIPGGFFGGIYARSGLATNEGLRPANCTGVVDADYVGEVVVALHNDSRVSRWVGAGDRIAQLIIQPYEKVSLEVVDELDETDRGDGGFGSTGK